MSIISHMGIDYDSPNVEIQDNPSATDLDNTKVPTGQTIKSYLNSKIKLVGTTLPSVSANQAYPIYTEANLQSKYIILGYSVNMGGPTWYQWQYNDVIKEFYINNGTLYVKVSGTALSNKAIYVVLYKFS